MAYAAQNTSVILNSNRDGNNLLFTTGAAEWSWTATLQGLRVYVEGHVVDIYVCVDVECAGGKTLLNKV